MEYNIQNPDHNDKSYNIDSNGNDDMDIDRPKEESSEYSTITNLMHNLNIEQKDDINQIRIQNHLGNSNRLKTMHNN